MTHIYLVRHAEAEGNIYRRAQGSYDGLITAKGFRQIDALAERFRSVPIDVLYSSDLRRTQTTAGAITRYHDLEIRLEPGLREIDMGPWEGLPWGNITRRWPEEMYAFNNDPDRWHVDGAESFPQVLERMKGSILRIAAENDGKTVACVSHGMAIRTLAAHILGISSENMNTMSHGDNTSVTSLFVENGEIRLEYCHDASHLPPELSTLGRQSWWRRGGVSDDGNLVFEPLDPEREGELYKELYAKTWAAVHGSLDGFMPEAYLASAKRHTREMPDAIIKAMSGGRVAGITELDPRRGSECGCGWISLCYVEPEYRRRLYGVQLLGHAVTSFRAQGRRAVRLCVFEENEGAIAFYREYGFRTVGTDEGVCGRLLIMEKAL